MTHGRVDNDGRTGLRCLRCSLLDYPRSPCLGAAQEFTWKFNCVSVACGASSSVPQPWELHGEGESKAEPWPWDAALESSSREGQWIRPGPHMADCRLGAMQFKSLHCLVLVVLRPEPCGPGCFPAPGKGCCLVNGSILR